MGQAHGIRRICLPLFLAAHVSLHGTSPWHPCKFRFSSQHEFPSLKPEASLSDHSEVLRQRLILVNIEHPTSRQVSEPHRSPKTYYAFLQLPSGLPVLATPLPGLLSRSQ